MPSTAETLNVIFVQGELEFLGNCFDYFNGLWPSTNSTSRFEHRGTTGNWSLYAKVLHLYLQQMSLSCAWPSLWVL